MKFKEFFQTQEAPAREHLSGGISTLATIINGNINTLSKNKLLIKFLQFVVKDAYDSVMSVLSYLEIINNNILNYTRRFLKIPQQDDENNYSHNNQIRIDFVRLYYCTYYATEALRPQNKDQIDSFVISVVSYAINLKEEITDSMQRRDGPISQLSFNNPTDKYTRYLKYLLSNKTLTSDSEYHKPFHSNIKPELINILDNISETEEDNNAIQHIKILLNDMSTDHGGEETINHFIVWLNNLFHNKLPPNTSKFQDKDWTNLAKMIIKYRHEFIQYLKNY